MVELDRHVARNGWHSPPRLFALVLSDVLAAAEPQLSAELRLDSRTGRALTAIEQDEFVSSGDLIRDLAQLAWPEAVYGCALATVRMFLPEHVDVELPADPEAAVQLVASHPQRQEIRVVVGADRAGNRHGVARLAAIPRSFSDRRIWFQASQPHSRIRCAERLEFPTRSMVMTGGNDGPGWLVGQTTIEV